MNKLSNAFRPFSVASRIFVFLLLLVSIGPIARADSMTDAMTPSGIAPGTPAGSYALSDFDNINIFNGSMNFNLPIHHVDGRGTAGYTMSLPIEQLWRVDRTPYFPGIPTTDWWKPWSAPYGPGSLYARSTSTVCDYGGWGSTGLSITKLTFTAADGTEFELIDDTYDGTQQVFTCANTVRANRGTVWKSHDGEMATFVSDSNISDDPSTNCEAGPCYSWPSGYLYLKDGTVYRIDTAEVSWIRDRNGNKTTFSWNNGQYVITDSNNRKVTVDNDVNDGYPYGLCDRITFKGFGGEDRYIRISKDSMSNLLRSGYSLQTVKDLFPELPYEGGDYVNPTKVSSVWLPDGRKYSFQYNSYAELARVELPTGGAYEYDYNGGQGSGTTTTSGYLETYPGYDWPTYEIYRRLTEKRTYEAGGTGSTYNRKTQYSRLGAIKTSALTEDERDNSNNLIARTHHYYLSTADQSFYPSGAPFNNWQDGKESSTEFVATNGTTVLKSLANTWAQSGNWGFYSGGGGQADDPRRTQVQTTLVDTNQVAKETYSYDSFNNVTNKYEYDYGSGTAGSLIRRTTTSFLTTNSVNSTNYTATPYHMKDLPTQVSVYDASSNEKSRTTFEYDKHSGTSNHASLIARSDISGLDSGYTTSYTKRGNVTRVERVVLPSTSIYTYSQYDQAGNVVKAIDGRGNATDIGYADSYGAPNGNATTNSAPTELSSVSKSSYAFPTSITNALSQVSYGQYDYYLGRAVDGQDINGMVASGWYDDDLDRPTKVIIDYNNLSAKSQKLFQYDDSNKKITTLADFSTFNDQAIKNEILYDGLGRTTQSRQYEGASTYIRTDQSYDALGRGYQTSNPYRSGDTVYQTTTAYDGLSRVSSVTTPDSAVVSTAYSGNAVTVTDQAGKLRRSITDALGRLTRLDEPDNSSSTGALGTVASPNQSTSYTYSILDDLTGVTQGSQTRTFAYDSLKRLTSATNPESGTITYAYDANSNMTGKTDARSITTTIAYDVLNRPTQKSYNDSPQTATVNYWYDSQSLPSGAPSYTKGYSAGRLIGVTYGGGAEGTYRGYDSVGRILRQYQRSDSTDYLAEATYNVGGPMATEVYPAVPGAGDRRTVGYSYDASARLSGVSSSATSYAAAASVSSIEYAAHNGLKNETYGNNLIHRVAYNNRLQPIEIKLGTSGSPASIVDIDYSYGSTTNNGNISSIDYNGGGLSYTQAFTYDSLNRLATANENSGSAWSQTNNYDRYGNRRIDFGGGTYNLAFGSTTNKITTSGYSYDSAGNLTDDTVHDYTFDAENKILKVDTVTAYRYDGEGQRVRKLVGENTRFIYGVAGSLVAEYDGSSGSLTKEYVNGGGLQATITPTDGTRYTTSDNLGSPRIVTNSSAGVVSRNDYMPFGEEISNGVGGRTSGMGFGVADGVRQQFTGQERDNETGLDYFNARYFASSQGRFTTADPILIHEARINDPQQLNLYSYARNCPNILTDSTGMDFLFDGDDWKKNARRINKRKNAQFKVKLDQNGIMQIKDQNKIDPSKLSTSEKKLYDAITDKSHRATITGVGKQDFNFGSFGGEANPSKPGTNYIDTSDMKKLAKADKAAAGQAMVHEMLEADYAAANPSASYTQAHAAASQYFPEPSVGPAGFLDGEQPLPQQTGFKQTWTWIQGNSKGVTVTFKLLAPAALPSFTSQPRAEITKIKRNK
jgi:RHS repeat-associated protein